VGRALRARPDTATECGVHHWVKAESINAPFHLPDDQWISCIPPCGINFARAPRSRGVSQWLPFLGYSSFTERCINCASSSWKGVIYEPLHIEIESYSTGNASSSGPHISCSGVAGVRTGFGSAACWRSCSRPGDDKLNTCTDIHSARQGVSNARRLRELRGHRKRARYRSGIDRDWQKPGTRLADDPGCSGSRA